jgi:hypothetical protein
MILQKINPGQIVSLHLNTVQLGLEITFSSLSIFTNIISLTLLNPLHVQQINNYAAYCPKLICLSLWYDDEVSFRTVSDILQQLNRPIRRFEIHCSGALCTHHHLDQLNQTYRQNFIVEYFLLDVGHFPLPSMNECYQQQKSCFLMAIIDFIKSMHNIRYVRLITNRYNIDKVFDWNEWKNLINTCQHLKKITVETLQSMLSGEQFVQKAMEIEKLSDNTQ